MGQTVSEPKVSQPPTVWIIDIDIGNVNVDHLMQQVLDEWRRMIHYQPVHPQRMRQAESKVAILQPFASSRFKKAIHQLKLQAWQSLGGRKMYVSEPLTGLLQEYVIRLGNNTGKTYCKKTIHRTDVNAIAAMFPNSKIRETQDPWFQNLAHVPLLQVQMPFPNYHRKSNHQEPVTEIKTETGEVSCDSETDSDSEKE